jgi:hypothetical protein
MYLRLRLSFCNPAPPLSNAAIFINPRDIATFGIKDARVLLVSLAA